MVQHLCVRFFTLSSSKANISKTRLFDIVTTHDDHPSYVKHVLGSTYVVFFSHWVLGAWVCITLGRLSPRWTCQMECNFLNLKLHYFKNPFVTPRMGLGNDVATIRVLELPTRNNRVAAGSCSLSP